MINHHIFSECKRTDKTLAFQLSINELRLWPVSEAKGFWGKMLANTHVKGYPRSGDQPPPLCFLLPTAWPWGWHWAFQGLPLPLSPEEHGAGRQALLSLIAKWLVLVFVKQTNHTQHHIWFVFHQHFQKQSFTGQRGNFHPEEHFQEVRRSNASPVFQRTKLNSKIWRFQLVAVVFYFSLTELGQNKA